MEIIHTLSKIEMSAPHNYEYNLPDNAMKTVITLLALSKKEATEAGEKRDLVKILLLKAINLHYFYNKLHKRALKRWLNNGIHGVWAMFAFWFWPNGGQWFSDTP